MATSKEKKEYIILAIILIAVGWVVYSNFVAPKNGGSATVVNSNPALRAGPGGTETVSGDGSAAGGAAGTAGGFLPNGANIDLGPVEDPRFKQLTPPNYPVVNRTEVGNPNPFK